MEQEDLWLKCAVKNVSFCKTPSICFWCSAGDFASALANKWSRNPARCNYWRMWFIEERRKLHSSWIQFYFCAGKKQIRFSNLTFWQRHQRKPPSWRKNILNLVFRKQEETSHLSRPCGLLSSSPPNGLWLYSHPSSCSLTLWIWQKMDVSNGEFISIMCIKMKGKHLTKAKTKVILANNYIINNWNYKSFAQLLSPLLLILLCCPTLFFCSRSKKNYTHHISSVLEGTSPVFHGDGTLQCVICTFHWRVMINNCSGNGTN